MKPRIQELYKQSLENKFDYSGGVGVKPGEYYSNYKTVLNAEKFAELIVRECIDCLKPLSRNHSMVGAAQDTIREHFGVER